MFIGLSISGSAANSVTSKPGGNENVFRSSSGESGFVSRFTFANASVPICRSVTESEESADDASLPFSPSFNKKKVPSLLPTRMSGRPLPVMSRTVSCVPTPIRLAMT